MNRHQSFSASRAEGPDLRPHDLLDEVALAKFLGVSTAWLQRARWAGKGGPVWRKIGRKVRYRFSDVQAYLDASARTSTRTGQVSRAAVSPAKVEHGKQQRRLAARGP